MEFFKPDTNIDFMGLRKLAAVISVVVCVASLVVLGMKGLNWGLEFTGGTEVKVAYSEPANLNLIRQALTKAGFDDITVQTYGTSKNVLMRMRGHQNLKKKTIGDEIMSALPGSTLLSVDYIGPQVGKELATNGALALFIAMLGTAVYVALRFEYRFAVSAAVALLHDPIIILGVFSYFQMEFDLISLAAILTIIGYSLNDTIVVFDRVRENFRKHRKFSPSEIVNMSVNQTLSRTIITSGLTLLAVLALFFYGGQTLHGFATGLLIGIVVGTYSSIYVAGALAVVLGLDRQNFLPQNKEALDNRP